MKLAWGSGFPAPLMGPGGKVSDPFSRQRKHAKDAKAHRPIFCHTPRTRPGGLAFSVPVAVQSDVLYCGVAESWMMQILLSITPEWAGRLHSRSRQGRPSSSPRGLAGIATSRSTTCAVFATRPVPTTTASKKRHSIRLHPERGELVFLPEDALPQSRFNKA